MTSAPARLWRRLTAEFLGSAFLAAVVICSGIAAQRLSPGQTGLQLLENAAATAAGLFAITPADAAGIIVLHHGEAGRAPASAAHHSASLSAGGRPPGPASLNGN